VIHRNHRNIRREITLSDKVRGSEAIDCGKCRCNFEENGFRDPGHGGGSYEREKMHSPRMVLIILIEESLNECCVD
jgi:hypothetical protein